MSTSVIDVWYTTGGQLRRLLFGIHYIGDYQRRSSARTEFKGRRHHIGDIGYLLSLWDFLFLVS
jgi:hypothetical protein